MIRLAGDTPGSIERVRGMMERQIGYMVRLVDDLLDVSRITSGKMQLHREPVPLDTLVNSGVEANRVAIAAKQIDLSVDLPATLCVLDVDPTRFIQVISNLLHNAVKFTEPGGSIRVVAHLEGSDGEQLRKLRLSVIDSGIGISPDLLPHIFELFTQGDRGSSQPGLGIGLALARRLVEMHGGEIEVRSGGPGTGSEFVIRLLVGVTDVPPRTTDEQIEATSLARRVVVIDHIRQQLGRDVTVIALTGWGQEHDRQHSVLAGFDAHLTKPADPRELARLLSQLPVNPDAKMPRRGSIDPQRP